MMEPDAVEIRVVGCLIEKQRTTPDVYPLSLNALRLACNQSTNREPVVDYDEETVVEALRRLALRGWTRLASGAGSRARKYRHLLDEALGLDDAEISLLAVLMLRGPQTPGELKQRSRAPARTSPTWPPSTRRSTRLVERGLVARHARRPGQKEDRYEQLLGSDAAGRRPGARRRRGAPAPRTTGPAPTGSPRADRARGGRAPRAARGPALGTGGRVRRAGAAAAAPGRVRPASSPLGGLPSMGRRPNTGRRSSRSAAGERKDHVAGVGPARQGEAAGTSGPRRCWAALSPSCAQGSPPRTGHAQR